jgi:hypothetical protein
VTDHYLYVDETGTLDFDAQPGAQYFGVGTAHYPGDHRDAIWAGHQLRVNLEAKGVALPRGLHAVHDSHGTRAEMYATIAPQGPRLDATMLAKANAYSHVKAAGKVRLYKMAFWIHLKSVIKQVSASGDRVFIIAGNMQTTSKRDAIRHAIEDVCHQMGRDRTLVPCIWEAPSSWGIQVIDYALWAVQRELEGKTVPPYAAPIAPLQRPPFCPWGRAK